MGGLLFSPNGEVTPAQFMKAALVLIIVSTMINTLPLLSLTLASLVKILFLGIAYCWIVIFIKRYRYGGQSPAMCLIPAIVFCLCWLISSGMVPALFGGEIYTQMQAELNDALLGGEFMTAAFEISQTYGAPLARKVTLPGAAIFAAFSFLIAWGFNKVIPLKPAS